MPEPAAESKAAEPRGAVREYFACHRKAPLYVFAENGHDYCLQCASDSYSMMGLRPAGRRDQDETLEELIQYELGGRRV